MMGATTGQVEWGVESVRATLFPLVAVQQLETVKKLWAALKAPEPEQSVSMANSAFHQLHGPFRDGRLVVSTQPGRIDVAYTANPEIPAGPLVVGAALPYAPESLGGVASTLQDFVERLSPALAEAPPVHRLALGSIVLAQVSSRGEGYRALQPLLPRLELDAENSADLIYQINRPRKSRCSIDGLMLNRISKWSVQATGLVPITLGTMSGTLSLPMIAPQFSARIEVDVNTQADFGKELPHEKLAEVARELADGAIELATHGDVR